MNCVYIGTSSVLVLQYKADAYT